MATPDLVAHLSTAERGQRYRAARDRVARSHLHIVGLFRQGRDEQEVAAVSGYGRRWIAAIVPRSNEDGPEGLGDRRARNAGAEPLLDEEGEAALQAALAVPPPEGGVWTGPKVAAWRGARLGRKVGPQRGWDHLRKRRHSLQVPRPRHAEAASAEEQELSKKLAERVSAHRRATPARQVEVGAFDAGQRRCPAGWPEAGPAAALASLGLASRRDPAGQRPIAVGRHRFEWLHLDGFVQPSTGEVVWFICNAVGTDLFSAVLAAFAQAGGAGAGKLVLLVVDNAGWHVRGKLVVPDGIELAFLPPYTPELQPAEPLWPLPNEAVAQQHFATLKDLATALDERCRALAAVPEVIKARTPFGWWPGPVPTAPAPN